MYHHEAGKGSKPRQTDEKKYHEGWDRIFGKKETQDSSNNSGQERKSDKQGNK